jgi:PAS domain S-box-containing protein
LLRQDGAPGTRLCRDRLISPTPAKLEWILQIRVQTLANQLNLIWSPRTLRREPEEVLPTLSATQSDISEHSRFLLAAIVDASEDAIISKDLNGIVTSWNKAASRMFGYEAEEMIGQPILRLIPERLHYEEVEILRKMRAGQRIERFETVRVAKSGKEFEVSLSISPVWDDAGRIIGCSKIAHDISERRRSDEARSRLAAIVESCHDAIVSKNLDGIITSWNAAARRMFGYTAEEIVGQPILRLIPEELHQEEYEILRKLRAGELIDHYETTRVKKNGERLQVSLTISPVKDSTGRVIGSSKIARDISARKEMERMLIQSEKIAATGRMAATIAHEINNPLEAVMNLVYLARKSCASDTAANGYLQTAEKEIERVSHIARQTLGYYRETLEPVEVVLNELLEHVLAVYQPKLSTQGISVECEFDDLRPIVVSKGELVQVFSNIIANSIDAMPRGGLLSVQTRETGSAEDAGVEVVIRDQGTGIEQEHLARVFEPFFTTKGNVGTGLGLWVAKQLVENRGGRITVTSSTDPEHSGTSIVIYIPVANTVRGASQ